MRVTGFQLISGTGTHGESVFGFADDLRRVSEETLTSEETGSASVIRTGDAAGGNSDASAPDRSNSSNCGITLRSSTEKPLIEERTDEAATRRERREVMHALCGNDHTRIDCAPMYKTQISKGIDSCNLSQNAAAKCHWLRRDGASGCVRVKVAAILAILIMRS